MNFKYLFLLVTILFCGSILKTEAQNIEYGLQLDTNQIVIGDQQKMTFILKSPEKLNVRFPQLKDTVVSGVEIISGPLRDSVKEKENWVYKETYVITSFDTGVYVIPKMPILIKDSNFDNSFYTNPIAFAVNTFEVDEQKGNFDIVLPYDTPVIFAEILPYILWVLLGIIVVAIIVLLVLRFRKKKDANEEIEEVIPPYTLAIESLDKLKEDKSWQAGNEKNYYTRLTDILRQYLSSELGIAALEQTSSEIIADLKKIKDVDRRDVEKLEDMFSTADFVKFAKFIPLQDENSRYLTNAYEVVNSTNKVIEARKAAKAAEEARKQAEEAEAAALLAKQKAEEAALEAQKKAEEVKKYSQDNNKNIE